METENEIEKSMEFFYRTLRGLQKVFKITEEEARALYDEASEFPIADDQDIYNVISSILYTERCTDKDKDDGYEQAAELEASLEHSITEDN
jgi:hypothetical protein